VKGDLVGKARHVGGTIDAFFVLRNGRGGRHEREADDEATSRHCGFLRDGHPPDRRRGRMKRILRGKRLRPPERRANGFDAGRFQ
jgi:hypothetical protein